MKSTEDAARQRGPSSWRLDVAEAEPLQLRRREQSQLFERGQNLAISIRKILDDPNEVGR